MARIIEEEAVMGLLDLMLKLAERHRFYVSLILVASSENQPVISRLLQTALRRSDVVFEARDSCGVLMAHTDMEHAKHAIARFRTWCDGDGMKTRFATATYPCDGATVASLMTAGARRLSAVRDTGFNAANSVMPRLVEPKCWDVSADNGPLT